MLAQCTPAGNPVRTYIKTAEGPYETDLQKENLAAALNDILTLPAGALKKRKYRDYEGNENRWDLATLIQRHFVPDGAGRTLGDNFYRDVKAKEVQEEVSSILRAMK
jgi:hypothetical protein